MVTYLIEFVQSILISPKGKKYSHVAKVSVKSLAYKRESDQGSFRTPFYVCVFILCFMFLTCLLLHGAQPTTALVGYDRKTHYTLSTRITSCSQLWKIGVIYSEQFCSPNHVWYIKIWFIISIVLVGDYLGGFSNQWGEINFSVQVEQLLTLLVSKPGFMCGLLRIGILEQYFRMVWAAQSGNPPCYSFSYFPFCPTQLVFW